MPDDDIRTPTVGELIRRQRERAQLSMKQLSAQVGISNPYLSQIERGLREPSERVLHQIADALKLSSDLLAEASRARQETGSATVDAIRADPDLTKAQQAALIEMYSALRAVTITRRKRGATP